VTEPIHDEQAEQAVLGSALLSPGALQEAANILAAEDFYIPSHVSIWSALAALWDSGRPCDPVAVAAELGKSGELLKCGGSPYLHTLTSVDNLPTTANVTYHARLVRDAAVLRRVIQAGLRISHLGESGQRGGSVAEVLEFVRREVEDASNHRPLPSTAVPLGQAIEPFINSLTEPLAGVVPTPWHQANEILNGGLRRRELALLAARTSVGKSLIGINIARGAASIGIPVDYLSGEMSRDDIMERLVADVAEVQWSHLVRHELSPAEWERVEKAAIEVADWPLRIDDGLDGMTAADIRSHCRKATRDGLGLVVVDQLSSIEPANPRAQEHKQLDDTGLRLRQMAAEFDLPVLLLHQLNRGPMQDRMNKRPSMHTDLRGTDALAHHAHKVILLWRPDDTPDGIVMIVDKNRSGPKGEVALRFESRYARVIPDDPYRV
jgi:replicative DNA helicase